MTLTDLKRIRQYVDDASLGEYGYRESEGALCLKLLDEEIARHDDPSHKCPGCSRVGTWFCCVNCGWVFESLK